MHEVSEEVFSLRRALPEGTELGMKRGEVQLGETVLEDRLRGQWTEGVVMIEPARFQGRHLFLLHEERLAGTSYLMARDRTLQLKTAFKALSDVEQELREWLDLYRQGLERPILFLPEASWHYAERFFRSGSRHEALREAFRRLRAPESRDRKDPYVHLFLPEEPERIVDEPEFASLAERFFRKPLRWAARARDPHLNETLHAWPIVLRSSTKPRLKAVWSSS